MNDLIYEHAWHGLPFAILAIDDKQSIFAANTAAESFFQMSERQMNSINLERIFGGNAPVIKRIKSGQKKNQSIVEYDVDVVRSDRIVILCDVYVSPLNSDMHTALIIFQHSDFAQTTKYALNNRIAGRSVTAMASMLAHEIRNPLAGILGATQLLSMELKEGNNFLEMIEQETQRIGDLVDRFEHFSDDRPIIRHAVNIHDVLDRVLCSAEVGFASHIRIERHYDPSLPDAIGNGDQLIQVFQNLLKNAAEAIDNHRGLIRISTSYNSGLKLSLDGKESQILPLQIVIYDNGSGISHTIISDIFDPFVTTKINGTGLGLSLVSKVISNHGGLVECKSDEKGTYFTIRLPIWHKNIGK